jgi:hypothetical protein
LRDRGVPELWQSFAGVRVWRQQDLVVDGRRVLEKKEGRNIVRGMHQNMVMKKG